MKRLLFVLLSFSLLGVVPLSASADNRMNLFSSRVQALGGTSSTFTASHSVGETYDWSLFRFEVERLAGAPVDASVVVRQETATSSCPGVTATVDATYQTCSYSNSGSRFVVEAGSLLSTSSEVQKNYLQLSAVSNQVVVYGVRGWVDANDNHRRDAFEPSTPQARFEVLPAKMGQDLLEYVFEPPTLGESTASAWVFANNVVSGIIDPTRLSYKIYEWTPYGSQSASGSFSYRAHPQIQAYQMEAQSLNLRYPAVYAAEVWYEISSGNNLLLASSTFDYGSVGAGDVKTSLVSDDPRATALLESGKSGKVQGVDAESATYTLTALDLEGKPLVGQDVYFYIDTFDLAEAQNLKVNGGYLISQPNIYDQVLLKRKTDTKGQVVFQITSDQVKTLGRISIDFRLNGLTSYSWGAQSATQHLVWAEPTPTLVGLPATQSETQWGKELNVYFNALDAEGNVLEGNYRVLGIAEDPIMLSNSQVSSIGAGSSSASFKMRLSRLATGAGSSLLTARLITERGEISEAYWRVNWNSEGFGLSAEPIDSIPSQRIQITDITPHGSNYVWAVRGEVQNGFGSPITGHLGTHSVRLRLLGIENQNNVQTVQVKQDGTFLSYVPVASESFTVQAELVNGDSISIATCSSLLPGGSCVQLGRASDSNSDDPLGWTKNLNDGTVKMYAKNIVGAGKVQFMLNGQEVAWVQAADTADPKLLLAGAEGSAYLVRTVDLVEGQKNVLEIYLDGVRITRTAYSY